MFIVYLLLYPILIILEKLHELFCFRLRIGKSQTFYFFVMIITKIQKEIYVFIHIILIHDCLIPNLVFSNPKEEIVYKNINMYVKSHTK